MGILNNIFRNKDDEKRIIELNSKVEELSAAVEKSALNDSLSAVIGSNFVTLDINKSKNSYGSNYVVWRGVNLLAQSIAQLPLRIYRGQEEMAPDFKFPLGLDLNSPNKEMSLYELLYQALIYYFYRGEFMIYIDLEERMSLEPINPKRMTRNREGNWKYNNKKTIPNEQLIYLPLFNPDNITGSNRGLSPIEVVKEEVFTDEKSREYNTKFFENFGKVGGVLYDEDGKITSTDMQILVEEFNQKHQGSDRAHKTLGLPTGIKYQELAQTMKEMQFLESRKDIRDRILSILGIHKSVFGVTDQVDRAVADTALRQLWIHTLQPNSRRIQEKFNQQLFKRYFPAYRCKFDFNNVVELQENKKDVLERAKIYQTLGYTTNEINEMFDLGMDVITDPIGDMRFVPTTLMPMDDLLIGEEEGTKIISNTDDKLENLAKYLDKEDKVDKSRASYIRKYNILRRASEKKIAGKMGKYFSNQLGKVLNVIKDKKFISIREEEGVIIENNKVKTVIKEVPYINKINEIEVLSTIKNLINDEKNVLSTTLTPVFREVSEKSSELALDVLGLTTKPIVDEVVVGQMVNKIVNINNYTYKLIRGQVKKSILEGETINQLSKRIAKVYKFNSARSRTIARTEAGALINRSTNKIYQDNSDIVKKKQWIGGTRKSHAAIDGQIKLFNEPFDNGLMYPHDPAGPAGEVINCTCCMAPVVTKE